VQIRKSSSRALLAFTTLVAGCVGKDGTSVTVQEVRGGAGGQVGLDLLVTTGAESVPCDPAAMSVSISASQNGGAFVPIDNSRVVVQCSSGAADVAVVVDNSGSEAGQLDELQAGASHLIDKVLAAGGRASLVRVSTNASVLQPLTTDAAALDAAVAGQFINNGWTALWDGVRVANETLGGDAPPTFERVGDARQFCATSRKLGIVAFTDGYDNNSADEQDYDKLMYPGDGIATTVGDLQKLSVDHVSTPIYTIGLGGRIDASSLDSLANASGGKHRTLDSISQIEDAFADISSYFDSTHQVCADLPWSVCGDVVIRTEWTWTGPSGEIQTGVKETEVNIPCEAERSKGRQASIVLTLSNPGIPRSTVDLLAANAVDWVAPVSSPRVLVVLDDGHHDEFVGDAAYVRDVLAELDYNVTLIDEPKGGLKSKDVEGYDVVWFTNPGYPFDDVRTIDTLKKFLADGGGVVTQGDDITQSMGGSFNVSELVHLNFEHNGTSTCGVYTDDNAGEKLSVSLGNEHPLLDGIEDTTFLYGDDIDQSTPSNTGEVVLGNATFSANGCTATRPVVSAFAPAP
jgi:hypothetical protein